MEASFTKWLFAHGCLGTEERLNFSQKSLRYEPRIKKSKLITIKAYFDPRARESLEWKIWKWIAQKAPTARSFWNLQETRDWLEEWKKHFKPFKLGGLQFVPAWQASVYSKSKTVIVEPGMAFGTGTHATTRFAIELLKKLSTSKSFKKSSVLDVGCGSGILSVCAVKMGALQAVGIDNDSEAWREAAKMFKLNKTRQCKVSKRQLKEIKKTYSVVVANIIDGVLMDLKQDLWRTTSKGGHLVLSGILKDGASAFIKAFMKGKKGRVVQSVHDAEWAAFIIQKY
ncbi:MAG: 50S ribosomal protein L11 methyltransferase [Oligoflexia bacterium]|nr:50S ribosomal protein L11 methyltransferase [Oligoflexia bacterium]